jgi:divalent metal cation (Fe/Co/Zn/Cd) transporter
MEAARAPSRRALATLPFSRPRRSRKLPPIPLASPEHSTAAAREALRLRGRRLEWLTLALCAVEAGVGVVAGVCAGSVALVGFGLDSLVEMTSALVLLWRLLPAAGGARVPTERQALRAVGACLLVLAAYVGSEAARDLWLRQRPEVSVPGIALALGSLVAMPLLARAKRRVAAPLHSAALKADALQADVCGWLAGMMLLGLALNAALGWWWADPAAALCMVPLIALEGIRAWRGQTCACVGCHADQVGAEATP